MRYTRQEILMEIGKKAQRNLRRGSAAIVGLGALGSVSAELLARAGIGRLLLIDRDVIELSNLQRQGMFEESDIGKPKAWAAKQHLKKINSEVEIDFFIDDLDYESITKIFSVNGERDFRKARSTPTPLKNTDIILDCTDNMQTRFLLNDFCIKNNIPLIHSSALKTKGYVFNIVPGATPCLRCFLKPAQLEACETAGVLNAATHIIASLQSNEAIKIILKKSNFETKLLFFDVWANELAKINVKKNQNCFCCGKNNFEYLDGGKYPKITKICGDGIYQVKSRKMDEAQFNAIKNNLKKIGKVVNFSYCINFENRVTLFEDGRALIKARDYKEAKSLYSRFVGD